MDPKYLTIAGLVLDIAGVAVVWFFGWPQPQLETGVSIGLEDGTPFGPSGETVADHNRKVEHRRVGDTFVRILLAAIAVAIAALNSGCTTLADARAARGTGVARVYDVPLDAVWKSMSAVLKEVGLELVGDNRQEGYLLAQRGVTPFSYGENVAIFVAEHGRASRTRVEVVSKKVMETNIFAPNWANDILDKLAEKLAQGGSTAVTLPATVHDVEAVPGLNEAGKQAYRDWLTKKPPRAFAIANDGRVYATWGGRPSNTEEPADPAERAMARCQRRAKAKCKLYAVDSRVVWIPE